MGGDDLGSDDEYLFDAGLIDTSGRGTAVLSSDDDDDNGSIVSLDGGSDHDIASSSKKRKRASGAGSAADDPALESSSSATKKKKGRVPSSSKNLLIHAGRGIATDCADAQATFLGTLYSHSIKLSESGAGGGGENGDGEEGDGGQSSSTAFSFRSHLYSHPESVDEKTKKFQHSDLAAFLKSGALPSTKRLKNWKHPQSPMVIVVTLSARRSVELMKQLSTTLKLPIAKLFAKHMSVEDQVQLLKGLKGKAGGGGGGGSKGGGGRKGGRCYGLAVGTPGRLLKLLRHGRDSEPDGGEGGSGGGALRLKNTEVVVLDCHEDSKGWNVCTLKDTSKELMEFVKEGVVPQLDRRKGKIKLAMF